MTYASDIHPEYSRVRRELEQHPNTFVLLPSFDRDVCVAETVRRQIARPFGRSSAKEEAVIRARFEIYMALPVRKIETMRPAAAAVDEIVAALSLEKKFWVGASTDCRRRVGGPLVGGVDAAAGRSGLGRLHVGHHESELLYGVEVSPRRTQDLTALRAFLPYVEVVELRDDAATHYAQIRADLKKRGQMIGANDLLIAAHARSLGFALVTNNTAEFGRVRG